MQRRPSQSAWVRQGVPTGDLPSAPYSLLPASSRLPSPFICESFSPHAKRRSEDINRAEKIRNDMAPLRQRRAMEIASHARMTSAVLSPASPAPLIAIKAPSAFRQEPRALHVLAERR